MPNAAHDHGPPLPAAPQPYPPAPANRTLLIVLAVVTAGALLVCCGGSAAAVVFFRSYADRPAAEQPASPAASPTPSPAPATSAPPPPPLPLDADRTIEGRGSKTVRVPALARTVHMLTMTHSGSGGFMVASLDGDGRTVGLLGHSYGKYRGTLMLDGDVSPSALQVRATGRWKLVIRDARRAPIWNGKGSGSTSAVYRIGPGVSAPDVRYTHRGRGNFMVRSFGGGSWDLLVNEIGRVNGETTVPDDTRFVEITADGAWTFSGR